MVLDVLRALGRRWYVVAVGVLLTAAMMFGAYRVSPPEYNARALILLLPSSAEVGTRGNPFLSLSGLEQPAGVLASFFSSESARKDVLAVSPTAEYQVGIDEDSRGPILAIDVTDTSAEATMTTLRYLIERVPAELDRLQEQVNARGTVAISSMELAVDPEPEADIRGTVRLVLAALIVGLIGTGFVAYAIDSSIQRRRLGLGSTPSSPPTAARAATNPAALSSSSGARATADSGTSPTPSWSGSEH